MKPLLRHAGVCLLVCLAALAGNPLSHPTALDRYVQAPADHYRFQLVKTIPGDGYTAYVIDLTSQSWRSASEIDRTLWKHWLTVIKPEKVSTTIGFLFITGGSNKDPAPAKADASNIDTALTTNSVVAELRMVPNQPLVFSDDGKARSEDAFIAYTWDKFLRTGDETWPARLPMTKSAVRAMDTITAFCASPAGGNLTVNRFVVAGGSKRGWTTWTTAAVDKRVAGIIPLVIDALNNEKSFDHHYRAYGFWSPAIKDYQDMDIMRWTGTPQYHALMHIEDPYEYRERLTMPKFMINAAGDQYFLPDSSQFYFDDLKGEKYLRYVPNADHSLRGSDARQSLIAYYDALLRGVARPRFSWKFEKSGNIRVKAIDRPTEVKFWQAANPEKRDFRLVSIGPAFQSTVLTDEGGGVYVAHIEAPSKGWTASFVELTFPSGGKYPFKFTTAVRIWPDTLPFGPPPRAADTQ